jgi:hypothetical protein
MHFLATGGRAQLGTLREMIDTMATLTFDGQRYNMGKVVEHLRQNLPGGEAEGAPKLSALARESSRPVPDVTAFCAGALGLIEEVALRTDGQVQPSDRKPAS